MLWQSAVEPKPILRRSPSYEHCECVITPQGEKPSPLPKEYLEKFLATKATFLRNNPDYSKAEDWLGSENAAQLSRKRRETSDYWVKGREERVTLAGAARV